MREGVQGVYPIGYGTRVGCRTLEWLILVLVSFSCYSEGGDSPGM